MVSNLLSDGFINSSHRGHRRVCQPMRCVSSSSGSAGAPFAVVADAREPSGAQALSKRIHYGKFVAEAKFLAAEDRYRALIEARDAEGIMDALTDRAVEQKARCVEMYYLCRKLTVLCITVCGPLLPGSYTVLLFPESQSETD